MRDVLVYMGDNKVLLVLLLGALILATVFWNLYRKEKKQVAAKEASVTGERKFYSAFVENRREFFFLLDKKSLEVLFVSPNFENMTGISTEIFRGDYESIRKLLSYKSRRSFREALKKWDQKETFTCEISYQPAGQKKLNRAVVLISDSGSGYLVSVTDITEEYKTRQELKQKLAQARRESQSKTDFLSQMSHEIRTPMNGILGMLNLMRVHIEDVTAAESYLERTEELSEFLLTLINDILDMSRIESGKMKLEKAPFDIYGLADKLDTMFRSTAEANGIHWEVKLQDFDVRYLLGDEMRLSQVIINFISNANKFTPSGGKVSVLFRQMDKLGNDVHLMIRVRDTGKGIKEDFISKIFRPFEQEDASTAHNYGGSGLGMAIADSIVKLMDGKILVESEEGKGSEFTVYLTFPVAQDMEAIEVSHTEKERLRTDEKRTRAVEAFTLKNIRILLAEDNDINAEIAMEILALEGAVVERAVDGIQVVEMFKNSSPYTYDVILMDIQMPGMDGWEATREIRKLDKEDRDIPVFAMSANAFLEDRRRSEEAGMNGHINKPVDYEELRRMIGEALYDAGSFNGEC